ncbi:uncharacterized protein LOC131853760 [Achroia grisella]|uniref:uncharacterized protein LOC131853760 n=1 Tax=Achroia grisella TaxID=688607 RepID=UPI0027D2A958|nr:uncharacterized protein LOC131853760 [Achroia grisella]
MNHATTDALSIIYNEGQWRLNKVSPLFNLQYDELKLKQYASKVRQSLVGSVTTNTSTKYTVQFEELPLLKYCEEDPSGLMITVSSTYENNAKSKVAYVAILLAWGMSVTLSSATHLPYLIERGEQKVGTAVKSILQTIFDCNVNQYLIRQHQLLQFGFSFLECDTSRSSDNFTLVYKTPQVDHKDQLNLTFDISDVHIIWNGVRDYDENRSELVNVAYQILQNQIFYMMALDVKVLDLCEVILPKAEIKSTGIVKMKTPEAVNSTFMVLNDITFNAMNNVSHITQGS